MLCRSFRISIDLDQYETRWIRYVLHYVESCYSRLANAASRILDCRLPERFDRFRLNLYVDVNDLHRQYCTAGVVLSLTAQDYTPSLRPRTGSGEVPPCAVSANADAHAMGEFQSSFV